MRWSALVFAAWSAGFALALMGLVGTTHLAGPAEGIVIERAPFCDVFIVQAPLGFVTAVDLTGEGGALSNAQRISGNLYLKGTQQVVIDGKFSVPIGISHIDTEWDSARDRVQAECQRLPDAAADAIASSF